MKGARRLRPTEKGLRRGQAGWWGCGWRRVLGLRPPPTVSREGGTGPPSSGARGPGRGAQGWGAEVSSVRLSHGRVSWQARRRSRERKRRRRVVLAGGSAAAAAVTFLLPHASIKMPRCPSRRCAVPLAQIRRITCFAGPGAPEAPWPRESTGVSEGKHPRPGSGGSVLRETLTQCHMVQMTWAEAASWNCLIRTELCCYYC